ncbi:MAG TPA: RDD family protein [Tepidisphaeraceae bacterium]|nr:RDD family protein [Tepidisphaeraceae bacterium]
MPVDWYTAREGQTYGPFPPEAILQMIASRQLWPTDILWHEGRSAWLHSHQIPEFAAAAAATAATPYVSAPRPLTPAPFGRRAAAAALDFLVFLAFLAAINAVDPMPRRHWYDMTAYQQGEFVGNLLARFLFAPWLYFAIMETTDARGTVGKQALGLKVVRLSGKRLGFWRASGRYFAKLLSAAPALAGFLMAAFTEKRQALHDRLAGTLVVRK